MMSPLALIRSKVYQALCSRVSTDYSVPQQVGAWKEYHAGSCRILNMTKPNIQHCALRMLSEAPTFRSPHHFLLESPWGEPTIENPERVKTDVKGVWPPPT